MDAQTKPAFLESLGQKKNIVEAYKEYSTYVGANALCFNANEKGKDFWKDRLAEMFGANYMANMISENSKKQTFPTFPADMSTKKGNDKDLKEVGQKREEYLKRQMRHHIEEFKKNSTYQEALDKMSNKELREACKNPEALFRGIERKANHYKSLAFKLDSYEDKDRKFSGKALIQKLEATGNGGSALYQSALGAMRNYDTAQKNSKALYSKNRQEYIANLQAYKQQVALYVENEASVPQTEEGKIRFENCMKFLYGAMEPRDFRSVCNNINKQRDVKDHIKPEMFHAEKHPFSATLEALEATGNKRSPKFNLVLLSIRNCKESLAPGRLIDSVEAVKGYLSDKMTVRKTKNGKARFENCMKYLHDTMPPEEFKAYCEEINQERGAQDKNHKDHIEPEMFSQKRTLKAVLNEIKAKVNEGYNITPSDCAMIKAGFEIASDFGKNKEVNLNAPFDLTKLEERTNYHYGSAQDQLAEMREAKREAKRKELGENASPRDVENAVVEEALQDDLKQDLMENAGVHIADLPRMLKKEEGPGIEKNDGPERRTQAPQEPGRAPGGPSV